MQVYGNETGFWRIEKILKKYNDDLYIADYYYGIVRRITRNNIKDPYLLTKVVGSFVGHINNNLNYDENSSYNEDIQGIYYKIDWSKLRSIDFDKSGNLYIACESGILMLFNERLYKFDS